MTVWVSQHAQYQLPEIKKAKWNLAIIHVCICTCAFPALKCQNVLCLRGTRYSCWAVRPYGLQLVFIPKVLDGVEVIYADKQVLETGKNILSDFEFTLLCKFVKHLNFVLPLSLVIRCFLQFCLFSPIKASETRVGFRRVHSSTKTQQFTD